jgi:hypothetical protein
LDDEGDNEEDGFQQLGQDESDNASQSSISDDALQDIVDWTQWNTRMNQEVLAL